MSAIWKRYPRGRALIEGRVRDVWIDPDPENQVHLSKAAAGRRAKTLGVSRRKAPSGKWTPVVLEDGGHRMAHSTWFRKHKGPEFEAPVRASLKKASR